MKATRRNFFLKAGTALSLPLAAGASDTNQIPRDHVTSIRLLQQALAREINNATGRAAELFADGKLPAELAGVTQLKPGGFGENEDLEISADGRTARAALHCSIETRVPIRGEGTLIEMARAQGEGFVRCTDRKILAMAYVREHRGWKIEALAIGEPAEAQPAGPCAAPW